MSSRNKLVKAIQNFFRQMMQLARTITKTLMNWLLRSLMVIGRGSKLAKSGFILPTVTMVILVVILLTTAIMFRAFDRSKNANNVRVDQAVLRAAEPALNRAKAKIEALVNIESNPDLTSPTPNDEVLEGAFYKNATDKAKDKYTFGDETRLSVPDPTDPTGTKPKYNAWSFEVDTDNNGENDSYTVYGIFFRTPGIDPVTKKPTPRNALEARTPPMESGSSTAGPCGALTAASLTGSKGWYRVGANLKRSFFVYAVTVPKDPNKPNKGFSALEYQQDVPRIPLSNNAVVFDGDLEIAPGPAFKLNGRVKTNGNFLTGKKKEVVEFYQVSSPNSCFYQEENGKMIVGGNVGIGALDTNPTNTLDPVKVHLYQPGKAPDQNKSLNTGNQSVTQNAWLLSYNTQAYEQRINYLVTEQSKKAESSDPLEVNEKYKNTTNPQERAEKRQKALEVYFKDRTRQVPFEEVKFGDKAAALAGAALEGSNETLRPPEAWVFPTNPNDGINSASYAKLTLNKQGTKLLPPATQPETQKQSGKESLLGDRVLIGNNLPALWFDTKKNKFVGQDATQDIQGTVWDAPKNASTRNRQSRVKALSDLGDTDRNGYWEEIASTAPKDPLEGKGGLRVVTGAGIYIDDDEYGLPQTKGLPNFSRRNIGGAPPVPSKESFLPNPTWDTRFVDTSVGGSGTQPIKVADLKFSNQDPILVWPDTMPMTGGAGEARKGDLLMRATAVYQYGSSAGKDQNPIACVSSYYDPTDANTARNPVGLPDVSGGLDTNGDGIIDQLANGLPSGSQPADGVGKSNNGVVYSFPGRNIQPWMQRQARLVFPNGRFANEALRTALLKGATDRTLADNAAIDTAICAFTILGNPLSGINPAAIPHGAIYETTFLDARQVKTLHQTYPITDAAQNINPVYDLSLEERQPQEVRVTALDLNKLRKTSAATSATGPKPEYLLPDSGIIYATRDDALLDLSDPLITLAGDTPAQKEQKKATQKRLSTVDFKLDPTRRSNGILLVNGSRLSRKDDSNSYKLVSPEGAEKGLILASNLPAYVQANKDGNNSGFNLHQTSSGNLLEEFDEKLAGIDWVAGDFYGRKNLDKNFACRKDDPRLPQCNPGDLWRQATVLADSVTLLSENFKLGFRNEGDYDLRNNQEAADKRKRNGFLNNNFVTSRNFIDSVYAGSNATDANYRPSSYFNNFVTPIQRRVSSAQSFEYLMEMCPKLPVSECQAKDWVVGYRVNADTDLDDPVAFDANENGTVGDPEDIERNIKVGKLTNAVAASALPFDKARLGAGTIAQAAFDSIAADNNPEYQRYARRVAFARNPDKTLKMTQVASNPATPIPLGFPINAAGAVTEIPYNAATPLGSISAVTNSLWFRTTNATLGSAPYCDGGSPVIPGCLGGANNITYGTNQRLYYLPPERGGNKLFLPDISKAPALGTIATALNGIDPNGDDDPADYAVCATAGTSKLLAVTTPLTAGPCPVSANIEAARTGLLALTQTPPPSLLPSALPLQLPLPGTVRPDKFYIYKLDPTSPLTTGVGSLTLNGDRDTVFVFQAPLGKSIAFNGVKLNLNGVDPNNIFWVSDDNLTFAGTNVLAGNFFGKATANPTISATTTISRGRLLGFGNPTIAAGAIQAMTSPDEPLLVPVLQTRLTTKTTGNPTTDADTAADQTLWMQKAKDTTFNLLMAGGLTPNRVTANGLSETNGGLMGFAGVLENWKDIPSRISGSFIQFKTSTYATAPFLPIPNTLITPAQTIFGYPQAYSINNSSDGLNNGQGRNPYYMPPDRRWGFDVGILSQQPDTFSTRFTEKPETLPDEFFREVGRDDPWVKNLMCAKSPGSPPLLGSSYCQP
ncbi:hormogonium polysaccharide biosynthesis protein HpsA [Coleofasciculus sp. FACHB-SPT9]|uniref:hormogonium polysaccharide biosynthesis protein HpsA n=1 Tax=Cyanophyceae TaxID=3028117 RepID=UPI001689886F|nr:hormogonium polysaccharide biosynthesis protein HpsA [Coleofasciculus sp. FACHB-SPT9]MBD1890131.1 DUF3494 domain-containing protein [Coleofasciculus sp. FACHB-SPT9]